MPDWLLLLAAMLLTGVFAGVLAGLFGIGGGMVIVPVLETVLGWLGIDPAIRMHIAVGTSLATIIPTSVASARAHHARRSVDLELARRWFVFVLIGALLGAFIASQMHGRVLAIVFAVFALLVAAKMAFFAAVRPVATALPRQPWVPAIPTVIGALSSMLGIGGGLMSVMTLSLFGQPIHRAVGTAALLGLAISLPGALGFVVLGWADPRLPVASLGYVSLIGLLCIAPATVLTAPLGARMAHAFSERRLATAFSVLLAIAAARLFYRALG